MPERFQVGAKLFASLVGRKKKTGRKQFCIQFIAKQPCIQYMSTVHVYHYILQTHMDIG